jgi:hypothetical protein
LVCGKIQASRQTRLEERQRARAAAAAAAAAREQGVPRTNDQWDVEDKFAVASGSKAVSVCYFEEQNDWWVSKHIKRHESTVTDIAWHPNNILLASSSSDNTVKVVSAFIRETDKRYVRTKRVSESESES